jgi:indolepyruvate ferredoxin oxidoreductase beta subunit
MFGALAGAGALPWTREDCETAIRQGGVGVDASLAGFGAAFDEAMGASIASALATGTGSRQVAPDLWAPLIATLPVPLHDTAAHAVTRLLDWQDARWAREYLEHLTSLAARTPEAGIDALAEGARQLALWMSYEDAIRVADLKTRPERFERIRAEAKAKDDEIVRIVDYLRPGTEEIAAILPQALGRRLRARAARKAGARTSAKGARGMLLSTSHVSGYLALRLIARLRAFRRRSLRFHEERAAIGGWLDALGKALERDPQLAAQIARLPGLLKGYGDTWTRGQESYRRIFDMLVRPALAAADAPSSEAAARALAIAEAIEAALADPEGRKREEALARAGVEPLPLAPKPIVWMRKPRTGDAAREIGENPDTAS